MEEINQNQITPNSEETNEKQVEVKKSLKEKWKGLKKPFKILIISGLAAAILTAVIVPVTVTLTNKNKGILNVRYAYAWVCKNYHLNNVTATKKIYKATCSWDYSKSTGEKNIQEIKDVVKDFLGEEVSDLKGRVEKKYEDSPLPYIGTLYKKGRVMNSTNFKTFKDNTNNLIFQPESNVYITQKVHFKIDNGTNLHAYCSKEYNKGHSDGEGLRQIETIHNKEGYQVYHMQKWNLTNSDGKLIGLSTWTVDEIGE